MSIEEQVGLLSDVSVSVFVIVFSFSLYPSSIEPTILNVSAWLEKNVRLLKGSNSGM